MRIFIFLFSLFGLILSCSGAEEQNLALGKKYTFNPPPNYHLCTDPEDRIQLTDGKTTSSYFWTQKGTVGWINPSYVEIVLDLGRTEPIDRISFTSAAGVAGVEWPRTAYVLVSEDGKNFYQAGDIIEGDLKKNGPYDNNKYSIRKIVSDSLKTKGRYVKLFLIGSGTFVFTDEIEILRGSNDLLKTRLTGKSFVSSRDLANRIRSESSFKMRYESDAKDLTDLIERNKRLDGKTREDLLAKVKKYREDLLKLPLPDLKNFKAVLPYNSIHQDLFALQADLWRRSVDRQLCVSANNCWEPVKLIGCQPEHGPVQGQLVDLLKNEQRYFTYLLFNTGSDPLDVSIKISGKQFPVKNIGISEVLWTDTASLIPVACAIAPLENKDGSAKVSLLPGIVKQIWFSVTSEGLSEGAYHLDLSFDTAQESRVTKILLTVHPLEMPKNTTLMTGGWDYSNGNGSYSVTPKNIDSFIKICKEHRVNAPWAQNSVMFACQRDPKTQKLTVDTEPMEIWLNRWKDSQEYFIFLSCGGSFLGQKIQTPKFESAVAEWAEFWRDWLVRKGYDPKKFNLLLVDEPGIGAVQKCAEIHAWAQALKKSVPDFRVWEDPVFASPKKMPKELAECADVYCPNRPQWLANPEEFNKFYSRLRQQGKTLNLYSCSGPVRLYDTWRYYLLQAWHCFQIDAKASFFWALGDGAGFSSWNEYLLGRNSYTPLFIDPNDEKILPGKMIKAMQIGVQDYEVLLYLKKEIAKAQQDPNKKDLVLQAQKCLDEGVQKVLKNCSAKSLTDQAPSMDRDLTDIVRREMIHWIFVLRHP